MPRNSDEIFRRHSDKEAGLEIRLLDSETVLIGGNREGLRLLGELLLAHADDDDKTQIAPNGAGSKFFASSSTHGLYIAKTLVKR